MQSAAPRKLRSVLDLAEEHAGFLVDLWGVVHDGERLHTGVREAIDALAARGARVVFLSNSSRLGAQLAETLIDMGVSPTSFDGVVSSGDVTREVLLRRDEPLFARFGVSEPPRALHIGSPSYVPWLFALGLDLVEDDTAANLVVATGSVPSEDALAALRARLEPLAARQVPLVCTNPDRVLITRHGLGLAPGAVAHVYAELGGPTFLYGKPHAPIYRAALGKLAALGIDAGRVVAIGDMIETDIFGARAAGLTSVLVTSGVHRQELGEAPDEAAFAQLFARHGAAPDAVMGAFGLDGKAPR